VAIWSQGGTQTVILKSETYNFHRLDLTRQAGFIVEAGFIMIVYDEDGLKLAATNPCSTPTEAFVEARKIVDNKIEGPRKKALSRKGRDRGEYERRDDYRFRSRGNNPVAVAEMAARRR
jgi:hypothetical protein